MSHQKPQIEPLGFRRRQQGCTRWLVILLFLAIIASFIMSSARYGF